jgi:hypothetical protein
MLAAAALVLTDRSLWLLGAALLTAIWAVQAFDSRNLLWAGLSLGAGLVLAMVGVERFEPDSVVPYALAATAVCWLYTAPAHPLYRRNQPHWWQPALFWAAMAGMLALALSAADFVPQPAWFAVSVLFSLGLLFAWQSRPWRNSALGYPAAWFTGAATLLAATQGFYTNWQPPFSDTAFVACGLSLGFGLIGWGLRRRALPTYGRPYAQTALLVLLLAPLPAIGAGAERQTLVWILVGLLLLAGTAGYGRYWLVAAAAISFDMALIWAGFWLRPAVSPADLAWILTGAVVVQTLIGLGVRHLRPNGLAAAGVPLYSAAAIGALAGLGFALGDTATLGWISLVLAAVIAPAASIERREAAAWVAWALVLNGAGTLLYTNGLTPAWISAWLTLGLVGLAGLGWLLVRLGQPIWARPTNQGGLVAAGLLILVCFLQGDLPALTFALASAGLLLTTLAVRERRIVYGYGAGAAFVAAIMGQLLEWGFSNPQWYVVPAGLYLLALAEGLRRFQQQRRVSQLIEAAAAVLILGTTLGQALRGAGPLLAIVLCGEALLLGGYGALLRLRAPFVAGVAFFVAGVLWMVIDALRPVNQWVLLGVAGLLMVAAYVLLERHQERLIRTGRDWAARLRSWG